jgi:hypothetical protein
MDENLNIGGVEQEVVAPALEEEVVEEVVEEVKEEGVE